MNEDNRVTLETINELKPETRLLFILHLKNENGTGFDFAPLVKMLEGLPIHKETWDSIVADSGKIWRFFDVVENYIRSLHRLKAIKEKGCEVGRVRKECRNVAAQAIALRNTIANMQFKLMYHFDTEIPAVGTIFSRIPEFAKTPENIVPTALHALFEIAEVFSDLGYNGNPKLLSELDRELEKARERQGKPKKKVIPTNKNKSLKEPRITLARELTNICGGVKDHAKTICNMIVKYAEGKTPDDLKNKNPDSIEEWLKYMGDRDFRSLPKRTK